ncbi:MAG: DUF423 domain-containing protein [Chloroflexi bacterium]|nr:DUF423 domain-containing protein [Chloroflexota bacterium]
MERLWLGLGAALAALGVMTGAFAAHGLKDRISPDDLDTWETAARYHLIHAVALLAVAYASGRWGGGLTTAAGWLFVAGIILFSGSLYALSLSGVKALGAITPFGGLSFIVGWILLIVVAIKG